MREKSNLREGQEVEKQTGKKFYDEKEVWTTPFKSQGETGLCALFSDISFLESELHRLGRGDYELSTMYVAYYFYIEKALRRIRLRGKVDYGFNGGFNGDAFEMIKKHGIVQALDYPGLLPGRPKIMVRREYYSGLLPDTEHYHQEFINEMHSYLTGTVEKNGKEGRLNSQWKDDKFICPWLETLTKILIQNMGEPPAAIEYNKKVMSPIQFSENVLSIPYDNYIKFTSYSYMAFNQKGELLADGNWLHKKDFWNIRLDEFIGLIDHALKNGFSLTGDIHITMELLKSEQGYADFRLNNSNTKINQNSRDNLFENWKTNDVHNVHIIGIARDENGKKYYKIKDSVASYVTNNPPIYFSENYFRARVLSVMLHKDGIPYEIKKRLKIN
jgi:bleomycin hydrolase